MTTETATMVKCGSQACTTMVDASAIKSRCGNWVEGTLTDWGCGQHFCEQHMGHVCKPEDRTEIRCYLCVDCLELGTSEGHYGHFDDDDCDE